MVTNARLPLRLTISRHIVRVPFPDNYTSPMPINTPIGLTLVFTQPSS